MENRICEIVAKNLDPARPGLLLKDDGGGQAWFTVIGKAAEFINFLKKGEFVEVKFDDKAEKIVYVRKTDSSKPISPAAEGQQEFQVGDHPAFIGMCMNHAFEYTLRHDSTADLTGFLEAYSRHVVRFVEAEREVRAKLGEVK